MGQAESTDSEPSPALLAAAAKGDARAFEAIVSRYERAAYGLVWRMCGDAHLCADICQDIFLQLYQQLPRYDASRPFSPWFFTLATNRAINSLKRRRNRRRKVLSELGANDEDDPAARIADDAPTAADDATAAEQGRILQEMVAQLPEKYSAIVSLRYLQDWSIEEIAEALEMPPGTVKVRLFRARDLLRQKMEKAGFAPGPSS